jgi:UDP-glucose 6-dehydrogenase
VDARASKTDIVTITSKKLYDYILTKFGCPSIIITNKEIHFINDVIKYLTNHFLLKHVSFITYYFQWAG